jgi:hypothetical protein
MDHCASDTEHHIDGLMDAQQHAFVLRGRQKEEEEDAIEWNSICIVFVFVSTLISQNTH